MTMVHGSGMRSRRSPSRRGFAILRAPSPPETWSGRTGTTLVLAGGIGRASGAGASGGRGSRHLGAVAVRRHHRVSAELIPECRQHPIREGIWLAAASAALYQREGDDRGRHIVVGRVEDRPAALTR